MTVGVLIMLPIAIFLDILGVICTILDIAAGVGEVISWVTDIAGTVIIGGWILFNFLMGKFVLRKGEGETSEGEGGHEKIKEKVKEIKELPQKKKKMVTKAKKLTKKLKGKKGFFRIAGGVIGEFVPIIGILPFWTWLVWSERKK